VSNKYPNIDFFPISEVFFGPCGIIEIVENKDEPQKVFLMNLYLKDVVLTQLCLGGCASAGCRSLILTYGFW
jgi:hypothetical protein